MYLSEELQEEIKNIQALNRRVRILKRAKESLRVKLVF
jgi:hypothetical protein